MNDYETLVADRIYRDEDIRREVFSAVHRAPVVAMNEIMRIVSRLYIDGIRDGAAFGDASRAYFTDEEWAAATAGVTV